MNKPYLIPLPFPSYANKRTIDLAKLNKMEVPQIGFEDTLTIALGATHVLLQYFGEGHTQDNIIGYFPQEEVMFGGCLIKELEAGKGYLGDANVEAWSQTVEKVKKAYPGVKIVVPGHGKHGGIGLLDYTIQLFQKKRGGG